MIITTDLAINNDFSQVPNQLILDDSLTDKEFRLWCRLNALRKGRDQAVFESVEQAAKACDLGLDNFRKIRSRLRLKGYLEVNGNKTVVTLPGLDFVPVEEIKPDKATERVSLRDTWNEAKPESFVRMKNPIAEKQLETLYRHIQHLSVETSSSVFLSRILLGCRVDAWWSSKNLKFDNIFGTGKSVEKKYTNVEKLYKLGASDAAKSEVFDGSPDAFLHWYHEGGQTQIETVVIVSLEEGVDPIDLEVAALEEGRKSEARVYKNADDGRIVSWSFKITEPKFYYLP